jgi:hypothetical protein
MLEMRLTENPNRAQQITRRTAPAPRRAGTSRRARDATLDFKLETDRPRRNERSVSMMWRRPKKGEREDLRVLPFNYFLRQRVGLRVRPAQYQRRAIPAMTNNARPLALGRTTESRRHPDSRRMSAMVAAGAPSPSHKRGFPTLDKSRPARRPRPKTSARLATFIVAITRGVVPCGPLGWPPASRCARSCGARIQKRHRSYSLLRKRNHHNGHSLSLPPARLSSSSLRA